MLTVIKTKDELMLFCALIINTRFTTIHHIFTNAIIYFTVFSSPQCKSLLVMLCCLCISRQFREYQINIDQIVQPK